MDLSTGVVDRQTIRDQLGAPYNRFGAAAQARHIQLLESVQRGDDVALHVEQGSDANWAVTVCTWDYIGALSMMSGLFTAYCFDIWSADVFTLKLPRDQANHQRTRRTWRHPRRSRPPAPGLPDGKLLDVFQVRALEEPGPDVWQRFQEDLKGLILLLSQGLQDSAREQVIERVSETARTVGGPGRQMLPVSVELDNDASDTSTQLSIRSIDTLGFLFAFTNALTMLHANIEHAEIRTIGSEVYDTFWLTDAHGRKIVSERRLHELRVAAVLIKHFTHLLPRSPNPAQALRQFNALTRQVISRPDWTNGLRDLESMTVLEVLADLMGVSRFLWEDFLRMQHENLFPVLLDVPSLERPRTRAQLQEACQQHLHNLDRHDDRVRQLNRFRDREMFRIDLRHITGRVGFRVFSEELTELAEVVMEAAAELSHQALAPQFGQPTLDTGQPCPWCICALGKFGGRELGFGSDIELVVVYEGEGVTTGPVPPLAREGSEGVIENSRYFGEFVRTLLGTLTTRREGIFEIDLRLRPHGNAGPLASTLGGFFEYYSESGGARQFERLALVKLRPVSGDPELGARVAAARDAFVYSGQPLDVENILHLRHRQATELVPAGAVSAKLSPGGLVDVEYFVQACQISVGHGDPRVRTTSTLEAIERLAQGGHLKQAQATELAETYGFLRRVIDALRVVRGHAKDLTIPARDSREFAYLANRLQYESTEDLERDINRRMGLARKVWDYGLPPAP